MNNIDKLTQKIFSKFNDDSLFYCNIYLTGTEEKMRLFSLIWKVSF